MCKNKRSAVRPWPAGQRLQSRPLWHPLTVQPKPASQQQHFSGHRQRSSYGRQHLLVTGNIRVIIVNILVVTGNIRVIVGNILVVTGNIRVIIVNILVVTGNARVIVGNILVVTGNARVIVGNILVVIGNMRVIVGNILFVDRSGTSHCTAETGFPAACPTTRSPFQTLPRPTSLR